MLPVTQQFSLSWKPEVRFFERRLDPLRALDEQGRVRSFSVQPTEIVVSLENRSQEIRYGSAGVNVKLGDSEANTEPVFAAVGEVFRIFEPERLGLARTNLQFLEELSGDYDELRSSWGTRFVIPPSGVSISDWALLINPDIEDVQPQWGGAIELGIVAGDEAKERLERTVGKLSSEPIGDASDRIEFPEVAFFADANFACTTAVVDTGEGLLQASLAAWTTITQKISELTTKVKDDFVGAEAE